ncbi:hypothetical protein MZI43_002933, partial [Listeria monocytogenes]|nr:hypothetical protein [Listeria monocytogenes]
TPKAKTLTIFPSKLSFSEEPTLDIVLILSKNFRFAEPIKAKLDILKPANIAIIANVLEFKLISNSKIFLFELSRKKNAPKTDITEKNKEHNISIACSLLEVNLL